MIGISLAALLKLTFYLFPLSLSLIVSGFGFDSRKTILLNIPFGFVQTAVILSSSYAATRFKRKSVILAMLCIPCIAGSAILYSLNRDKKYQGPNLLSYYLLAFLFGGNPLIVSWIAGNNAGQTKKALVYSLYNAGSSVGNIVGRESIVHFASTENSPQTAAADILPSFSSPALHRRPEAALPQGSSSRPRYLHLVSPTPHSCGGAPGLPSLTRLFLPPLLLPALGASAWSSCKFWSSRS